MAYLAATSAALAAQSAFAQDFAGNYRITSDVTAAEVPEWGPDCGQRPENHRGSTGRTVRVSEDGTNLVIEDRPRMRTDGCWSQNPRARRSSTNGGAGRWTTQCSSPAEDYQREEGTYTTTFANNTLTLRDRTVYRWTLQSSSCRATITRTMVYERQDAPAPADSGVAPPTPHDSGVRAARCALPGPASRLAIVAGRRSTTPGSRVCFRAQLQDTEGCAAINSASAVITWTVARRSGAGDAPAGEGGCVTIAPSVAAGTEFTITASSSTGLEERVTLRVVTAEESNSLVAQIIDEGSDAGASESQDAGAAPRIDEGVGTAAPPIAPPAQANSGSRNAAVAGLTAIAVLLAGAAFFVLRKKKPEPTSAQDEPAPSAAPTEASAPPRAPEAPEAPKKAPPTSLAQTMIGAMPTGTDNVLENAAPRRPSASSMPATQAPAPAAAPVAASFPSPAHAASAAAAEAMAPVAQKTKRCPVCNQRFTQENAFCPDHGAALIAADDKVIVHATAPSAPPPPAPEPPSRPSKHDPLAQTHIAGSAATATVTLRCPKCGRGYGPGNIFCGDDGSRLEGV